MKERNYRIIVFEGLDGTGKSSAIHRLADELSGSHKVYVDHLIHELPRLYKELYDVPSGKIGEFHRHFPADFRRASYVFESAIQMRIKDSFYSQYDFVLFDRWFYTDFAYLPEVNWYPEQLQLILDSIPVPDLTFYLDVDVNVAIERLRMKDDWMLDTYDMDTVVAKLQSYKEGYDRIFPSVYKAERIDSNLSVDEVYDQIKKVFSNHFIKQQASHRG
ncbi:hypothetical protein PCURB6_24920 [Paenibacillus curdlanolyticus]|nr:hypothetical protein PCURB6_24920 [Paenibacillus curdlanolyticus]